MLVCSDQMSNTWQGLSQSNDCSYVEREAGKSNISCIDALCPWDRERKISIRQISLLAAPSVPPLLWSSLTRSTCCINAGATIHQVTHPMKNNVCKRCTCCKCQLRLQLDSIQHKKPIAARGGNTACEP